MYKKKKKGLGHDTSTQKENQRPISATGHSYFVHLHA